MSARKMKEGNTKEGKKESSPSGDVAGLSP